MINCEHQNEGVAGFLPTPQYERIYWVFVLRNLAIFLQKSVECRDGIRNYFPAPCRPLGNDSRGIAPYSFCAWHEQI